MSTTTSIGELMVEVHCRGCKRPLGVAPADFRIYCDLACAADYPAVQYEERDALLFALWRETKWPRVELARHFGVARQRVDQIINRRMVA